MRSFSWLLLSLRLSNFQYLCGQDVDGVGGILPSFHHDPMYHQAQQPEQHPDHLFHAPQKPDGKPDSSTIAQHRENQSLAAFLTDELGGDQKGCALQQQADAVHQQCEAQRVRLMKQVQEQVNFKRPQTPRHQIAQGGNKETRAVLGVEIQQELVSLVCCDPDLLALNATDVEAGGGSPKMRKRTLLLDEEEATCQRKRD